MTFVLASREERFSRNLRFLAAFVTDGDTADPALATSNVEICYNQVVGCSFLGIALFVGLQQIAHDNNALQNLYRELERAENLVGPS